LLVNLTEHRCPECGRPFDPNNSDTFDASVRKRLDWGSIVLYSVLFTIAFFFMLGFPRIGRSDIDGDLVFAVVGAFFITAIVYIGLLLIRGPAKRS